MQPNLTNWREAAHNQWAFQNIDKILTTHSIAAGPPPKPFATSPQDLSGFSIDRKGEPPLDLAAWLAATETDGLVILQNGNVVFEQYDRGNTEQSKHILMSLTKSVTGLLVGVLAAQSMIDVEAPVANYVPEIRGSALENATVRQCLDMRSGVKYDDNTHEYRAAAGWNEFRGDEEARTLHAFIASFRAPAVDKADGVEGFPFQYVSVNTDLLGWVLERATGKTFAELVSELLWVPMGAESDALVAVDAEGSARAAGGMCVVLRDLARVGQLVLRGGDGIVPKEWIEDMLHGGSLEAFAAGPWADIFPGMCYRSCWFNDKEEIYMGMGVYGQFLVVDRKSQTVMARTNSQPDAFDIGRDVLSLAGFKELRRLLSA